MAYYNEEAFIHNLELYPCLYNKQDNRYKYSTAKNNAWKAVAEARNCRFSEMQLCLLIGLMLHRRANLLLLFIKINPIAIVNVKTLAKYWSITRK